MDKHFKNMISRLRKGLLFGVLGCCLFLISGCGSTLVADSGVLLSYHTGNPDEMVAMEATEQFSSAGSDRVFLLENVALSSLEDDRMLYLKVEKDEQSKVTVTCDGEAISLENEYYPIQMEKNARITVVSEYRFFFSKESSTYTFQCTAKETAKLTNILYKVEEDDEIVEYSVSDFDKEKNEYTVERKVPYDNWEIYLCGEPQYEEFEVDYTPDWKVPVSAQKGKETTVSAKIIVTDPTGEYEKNTYTVNFTVEAAPAATPKPISTPKPTVTPKPTSTPKPTATPSPTIPVVVTPIPTVAPTPTMIPTVTPSPTVEPELIEIPNLVGLGVGYRPSEVAKTVFEKYPQLKNLSIKIQGDMEKGIVFETFPSAGSRMYPGGELVISVN